MTENIQCPICKKQESKLLFDDGRDFFVAGGDSDGFGIRYCEKCAIGFSVPEMTDKELAKYYPDDFEAYIPKKFFSGYLQTVKYKQDLNKINKALKPTDNSSVCMFEIGAGRGEFLYEAKKQNIEVAGIEPGNKGIEFAKEHYDINVQHGFASNLKFEKKYDVVVMRHVLEHIGDIKACLENICANGLKDNGLLFIKVPNMDSWEAKLFGRYWDGFDLPRHRFHFTKQGLRKILTTTAFNKIKMVSEIVPTATIRSIKYYANFEKRGFMKFLAKIYIMLPAIIKMFLAQCLCLFFSVFVAGRMIILAQKNNENTVGI